MIKSCRFLSTFLLAASLRATISTNLVLTLRILVILSCRSYYNLSKQSFLAANTPLLFTSFKDLQYSIASFSCSNYISKGLMGILEPNVVIMISPYTFSHTLMMIYFPYYSYLIFLDYFTSFSCMIYPATTGLNSSSIFFSYTWNSANSIDSVNKL